MRFNKKLDKVRMGQVKVRNPYYLVCVKCGVELSDDSIERLVSRANGRGWRYDYLNDRVICGDCVGSYMEEDDDGV